MENNMTVRGRHIKTVNRQINLRKIKIFRTKHYSRIVSSYRCSCRGNNHHHRVWKTPHPNDIDTQSRSVFTVFKRDSFLFHLQEMNHGTTLFSDTYTGDSPFRFRTPVVFRSFHPFNKSGLRVNRIKTCPKRNPKGNIYSREQAVRDINLLPKPALSAVQYKNHSSTITSLFAYLHVFEVSLHDHTAGQLRVVLTRKYKNKNKKMVGKREARSQVKHMSREVWTAWNTWSVQDVRTVGRPMLMRPADKAGVQFTLGTNMNTSTEFS